MRIVLRKARQREKAWRREEEARKKKELPKGRKQIQIPIPNYLKKALGIKIA
jgi:hypothetical protein